MAWTPMSSTRVSTESAGALLGFDGGWGFGAEYFIEQLGVTALERERKEEIE